MSSTLPGGNPPPREGLPLERVELFPVEMGHIKLEITVGGKVAYDEVFLNWATALDLTVQIVRDKVWEIVIGDAI